MDDGIPGYPSQPISIAATFFDPRRLNCYWDTRIQFLSTSQAELYHDASGGARHGSSVLHRMGKELISSGEKSS